MKLVKTGEEVTFKRLKGVVDKLYSDERTITEVAGGKKAYYDPSRVQSRDQLAKEFVTNLNNPTKAAEISETLLAINGIYAEIIQYYVTMPLYRYTVIPSKVKKLSSTITPEKYATAYEKMISVVDGISLEVVLPKILQTGLTYGIIYMYLDKNQSSETVETLLLPNAYCRRGFTTNFGTETVSFDFKFFDDIKVKLRGSNGMEITEDILFDLFPAALITQYKAYLRDKKLRWQELDPKYSAAILFSPTGVPPKLYANYGIIDYEVVKKNEVTRSNNELEKILVHEIPHTAEGNLMFEVEEALELHDSLAQALSGVKGLKLLTTFGKTELIELQKERAKDSQLVQQAYRNIFQSAGINPEIFAGTTKEALQQSIVKDAGYIFKLINSIINLYNLGVNNLYNFSPFQARISVLPITIYDEKEKVDMYLNSATFGIGKLEAIVATGIKQKDIADKHELEKFLDLDNILVPLQSSHTSSGAAKATESKTGSGEEPTTKETKEEEETEEVEDTQEVDT